MRLHLEHSVRATHCAECEPACPDTSLRCRSRINAPGARAYTRAALRKRGCTTTSAHAHIARGKSERA
eukprot:5816203-Alexandrium_andersonii.AAC.1